ncbi:thyrotropin-releasing hormone receptor-like isoform X1 [Meriones unguiculatus]|uniref:thyrotropin-releasing hormone receptor-like isoform X1 n=2 Tax=Meriones unguiculatus TaxID=10047 RepID=UPI00293E03D6|nr:thyrotropin-releasing hormone receptor-like isoform X1 [Meriones unguiculatus]
MCNTAVSRVTPCNTAVSFLPRNEAQALLSLPLFLFLSSPSLPSSLPASPPSLLPPFPLLSFLSLFPPFLPSPATNLAGRKCIESSLLGLWGITENASKMDGPGNVSLVHGGTTLDLPEYKVVSVFLVLLVCTLGIVGNAMVVLVVLTSHDMHTPTNCYLVSLALADLIVLVAAGLPNVSDSLVGHWIYGHAGCLGITYFQYLGINVSSWSILAFTVERYIAICHPMRAQTVCTVARAKRIIAGIWGVTSLYCLLWFFLVDLNVRDNQRLECGYKVSRGLYLPIYLLDFAVFFIAPLLVTIVLYGFIGRILFQSPLSQEAWQKARRSHVQGEGAPGSCSTSKGSMPSRKQATRMLAVIVLLFAVLWTPYRTLVLLNSFLTQPFLDPWVLLFCRTCVYTNSAINPVIYSLMSQKFRAAFLKLCCCGAAGPQRPSARVITGNSSAAQETPLGTEKMQLGSNEASGPTAADALNCQQEPHYSVL